ncbi:MAG: Flp family type IVb pilin [Acetobacteraceae bacterium]
MPAHPIALQEANAASQHFQLHGLTLQQQHPVVGNGLATTARGGWTMGTLLAVLRELVADRRSVTALEYALIASVTIVAMAIAVPLIGTRLAQIFSNLAASF